MLFLDFANTCREIEKISSRLAMTDLLAEVFPQIPDEELAIFVRFARGKLFPDWSAEKLNFGPSLLYEALAYVIGKKREVYPEKTIIEKGICNPNVHHSTIYNS